MIRGKKIDGEGKEEEEEMAEEESGGSRTYCRPDQVSLALGGVRGKKAIRASRMSRNLHVPKPRLVSVLYVRSADPPGKGYSTTV